MAKTTELFRLRIFTIGIQELAYLATSRGKQVYWRHRNLSPHSWLRIPLSLSERKVWMLIYKYSYHILYSISRITQDNRIPFSQQYYSSTAEFPSPNYTVL
jgi:hypothetical protein